MTLKVCETFASILGESTLAGSPAFFIRLSGCNLRCRYCDTVYAYDEGEELEAGVLLQAARDAGLATVLVTGGEPLWQDDTLVLLASLAEAGLAVLLETNGSLPIAPVDPRVRRIVDVKCPGSGMVDCNRWDNLAHLTGQDEVKFVLSDAADFAWCLGVVREYDLLSRLPVLLSPVLGLVDPRDLVAWILESRLPLRLNLQLHKYIWGPERRGV